MRGRFTAMFPSVFGVSPFIPILGFINLFIRINELWFFILLLIGVEMMLKALKMNFTMCLRLFTRGVVSLVFGGGVSGMPVQWKRRHWPLPLLLLAFTLPSNEVYSEFTITDSSRWEREWRSGLIGMSDVDILDAMCNDCPLDLALTQILPPIFTPFVSPSTENIKVSFTAGRPWGMVLSDLASENNLSIEIMKSGNRVVIEPSPKNRGAVTVTSLLAKKESFYGSKTWELIPGDTLKESFERWARSENWTVLFKLDRDIRIDPYAKFQGNLLQAIEDALSAYRASGVLSRVHMTYSHDNNAIRISLSEDGK
jgi:virulence-associated protein VagC